jgi:DcaP outer membrane protein
MAIESSSSQPRARRTGLTALAAVLWLSASAASQAQAPAQPSAQATTSTQATIALEDLRRLVDEQRALIDRQAARLDAQDRDLADLRTRVDAAGTLAAGASNAVAELKRQPGAPTTAATVEQRNEAIEQSTQRTPEMPAAVVSAGEFPGSIRVPGTDSAIKFGGQARMTLVHTLAPLGVDDRFITSSIPVEGSQIAGEDKRTTYTPAASRVNVDLRSPSRVGDFRTFLEWDFAATGRTARLRHAFIQARRWTIGQTWSTFSDPEAEPIGIDFEGLNAISLFRQPQIRFTESLRENLSLSLAVENPAPDLTGAEGVNLTPDFIVRARWEPSGQLHGPHLLGRTAHVQAALLVRALRGELTNQPETTLSTGAFGANVSGVLIPRWDHDDRIKFAANTGRGIGRYITDLGTLGGEDAIYDPATGSLEALQVYSSYIGYERNWKPTFTSAVTYGLVRVNNVDAQPGDALRETQRGTLNLTWTPITQLDLVIEFLTGRRLNKDGGSGTSSQIQAGWTFRF